MSYESELHTYLDQCVVSLKFLLRSLYALHSVSVTHQKHRHARCGLMLSGWRQDKE